MLRSATFVANQRPLAHWYGSAPRGADAIGTTCDLDLIGDLQALAVEADDGERVVHHALRKEGLAVMTPSHALRPLPDFGFGHFGQRGSLDTENDEQAVIVVKWMGRRQIRTVLRDHSEI